MIWFDFKDAAIKLTAVKGNVAETLNARGLTSGMADLSVKLLRLLARLHRILVVTPSVLEVPALALKSVTPKSYVSEALDTIELAFRIADLCIEPPRVREVILRAPGNEKRFAVAFASLFELAAAKGHVAEALDAAGPAWFVVDLFVEHGRVVVPLVRCI